MPPPLSPAKHCVRTIALPRLVLLRATAPPASSLRTNAFWDSECFLSVEEGGEDGCWDPESFPRCGHQRVGVLSPQRRLPSARHQQTALHGHAGSRPFSGCICGSAEGPQTSTCAAGADRAPSQLSPRDAPSPLTPALQHPAEAAGDSDGRLPPRAPAQCTGTPALGRNPAGTRAHSCPRGPVAAHPLRIKGWFGFNQASCIRY